MPDADDSRAIPDSVPLLLRDTLTLAGVPERVQDVLAGMPFSWRGQRFTLHVGDMTAPGARLVVHAELGALTAGHEVETCELLLRSNLMLAGNVGPTFGMQLDGGGVLMLLPLAVDGLTAPGLLEALHRMADAAEIWRDTRGFAPPPATPVSLPPVRPRVPLKNPFGATRSVR